MLLSVRERMPPLNTDAQKAADAAGRKSGGMKKVFFRTVVLVAGLCVAAVLAEAVLRVFFARRLAVVEDERHLLYQYDSTLGWFPVPNTKERVKASRTFTVVHNSTGFRDREHQAGEPQGIIFLGDSFVWGYDVDAAERFTDKLQARHPQWNVYNFGVSGYGTDQEYLLLQKYFAACKPKVVFLIFSTETDDYDNSTNVRYGGFYKPYCTVEGTRLELHGVPVPRGERVWLAEHPGWARSYLVRLLAHAWFKPNSPPGLENPSPTGAIIRDLQKFVQSQGAAFLVGLTDKNPKLEEFLGYFGIPFLDLSTSLRYPRPEYGRHWTAEGHSYVCDRIEQFLLKGKYLGSGSEPATFK